LKIKNLPKHFCFIISKADFKCEEISTFTNNNFQVLKGELCVELSVVIYTKTYVTF